MQAASNSANAEGSNACSCPVPTFAHVVAPRAAEELTASTAGAACADRAAGVSNLASAVFTWNAV